MDLVQTSFSEEICHPIFILKNPNQATYFQIGCKIPNCTVFPEFNHLNPDMNDDRYNTEMGIYSRKCGLDKLLFAYGHDEYLYQMLLANKSTIPAEGLAMVRFHSAYPWHTGGAYKEFMTEHDEKMLDWILEFNKFDLYTKDEQGLRTITRSEDELWVSIPIYYNVKK